jgi:agmatine deiminase
MINNTVLPAEWQQQDAILITWPHSFSAWATNLATVELSYIDLTTTLSHYQDMIIQLHPSVDLDQLLIKLTKSAANLSKCHFVLLSSNDTWARDHGPIGVVDQGTPTLLDFTFNGWGNKFAADLDNQLNQQMANLGIVVPTTAIDWVLEGGSLESDGQGTLLTTSACLLNSNRNGKVTKAQVQQRLAACLGINRILWLESGALEGDDTDAHIDTLARFASVSSLIYQGCSDPLDSHYPGLNRMKAELAAFRTLEGLPYELIELPWPSAKFAADGHRLPASYANFLITNKLILVPTYEDPMDILALEQIQRAFPNHFVSGINALPLIEEHGSLHCITMQLPQGTVNFAGRFETFQGAMR